MSDSVRPHRLQPTRLPCPWDSPGKNTGVGCHFLLQCMKVKSESEVAWSCPTLSDPMDCSPPGSSVHGIFQARILEWGAIAFSMLKANFPLFPNYVHSWSSLPSTCFYSSQISYWKQDSPYRDTWFCSLIMENSFKKSYSALRRNFICFPRCKWCGHFG